MGPAALLDMAVRTSPWGSDLDGVPSAGCSLLVPAGGRSRWNEIGQHFRIHEDLFVLSFICSNFFIAFCRKSVTILLAGACRGEKGRISAGECLLL